MEYRTYQQTRKSAQFMKAFLTQAQPLAQPPNQSESQGPNQAKTRSKSPFIFPEYQSDLSSDDKELVQGPSVSKSTEMSDLKEKGRKVLGLCYFAHMSLTCCLCGVPYIVQKWKLCPKKEPRWCNFSMRHGF